MLPDTERRAVLFEVLIAGGLTIIGLVTGQGPLLTLAETAAGTMGINWITSLAERGFQQWQANWFTKRGALHQDIVEALLLAFQHAVGALEQEWKHHPHYLDLQRTNPTAAQITLNPLHWLSEDAIRLFQQQPEHLALVLQQPAFSALLHWDQQSVRHFLADKVGEYLYDHDAVLVDFIKSRLADEWLLQLGVILNTPDERGTRAWRAYQRLWQASLEMAMDQLGRDTSEVLAVVRWLRDWAERLEHLPRDATGVEALEKTLHPVRIRLDEIKAGVERTEAGVERIEASLLQLELGMAADKAWPAPFLVPPLPSHPIIGRGTMLHDLKRRLFTSKTLTLTALDGLPGVGKTTLAIALAHDPEVREHFSDGVLWAGLGKKAQEADILTHLGIWATAVGISYAELEKLSDLKTRQQRIQAAIGQRKMLLVADDVWDVEAALNVKLGGDNCAYLVTTRLPAIAEQLTIDGSVLVRELTRKDSLKLLEQFAPEAVQDAPDEASMIVQAAGELPLALTLMGKYLRVQLHHQQTLQQRKRRLRTTLNRLHQAKERLQLAQPQGGLEHHPSLPPGAPLSLKASIDISYTMLGREARRVLRALSVFPAKPNSFSEAAALTVSATSVETLDLLTDAGLVENSGDDRYMLHQTIADYARVKRADPGAEERMATYYVSFVEAHQTHEEYALLDQEASNILTGLELAFKRGLYSTLIQGTNIFARFLTERGMAVSGETHLRRTVEAATKLGDAAGRARALYHLSRVMSVQGKSAQEEEILQESLKLARQAGDHQLSCLLLRSLGILTYSIHGDYPQAMAYLQEGLDLARQTNQNESESAILQALGVYAGQHGNYQQAESYLQDGLTRARQLKPRNIELLCSLLQAIGWVASQRGNYQQAKTYYQESLVLARRFGLYLRLIQLLRALGALAVVYGDYQQAEMYLQEGLHLVSQRGRREEMIYLLEALGEVEIERGDLQRAEAHLQEGLELARQSGHRELTSNMLLILSKVFVHHGNYEQAAVYLQEGLELARQIGEYPKIVYFLNALGGVAVYHGNYEQAAAYLQEGLELARQIGFYRGISDCLNMRGELYLRTKQLDSAEAAFLEALETAPEGNKLLIATAHYGLAKVAAAQGKHDIAQDRGKASLAQLEQMGHSKAAEVREWLRTPLL